MITGGAGFIGSALARYLVNNQKVNVVNYDKLTYAGNLASLDPIANSPLYTFVHGDICDHDLFLHTLEQYQPSHIVHLAAESHVDNSIDGPFQFLQTNIIGTYQILQASRAYFDSLPQEQKDTFRFHHVSTDEVFGDLSDQNDPTLKFTESTAYDPSSPYAATKASSDHIVRSWARTYGLPVILTNCSNNYGPYQLPEKLIPHMILSALQDRPLPIYGNGQQIRDWLYVDDHADALWQVLQKGNLGESFNIGGNNERTNLSVVKSICKLLEEKLSPKSSLEQLIVYVEDRPGHDARYAIDNTKLANTLNWHPSETFESGLSKTIDWYLANENWWQPILQGTYQLHRAGLEA